MTFTDDGIGVCVRVKLLARPEADLIISSNTTDQLAASVQIEAELPPVKREISLKCAPPEALPP